MSHERRRHPRISSRVRVEFVGRSRAETHTLNVSRNGVFLGGDAARAVNSLVRLKLFLPPAQEPIEIFGRVAWKGKVGNVPGLGIHFLELDSKDRERWVEFVARVEQLDAHHSQGEARPPGPPAGPEGAAAPERRQAPRTQSSFMVRFKSRETLQNFVTKNLSAGGMFLATPVLKTLGAKIQVVLVHPVTQKDFELEAEVVRVNEKPTAGEPKGMALKFAEPDGTRNEELEAFLEAAPPDFRS